LTAISMADLLTPAKIVPQLRAANRYELLRKLASCMAADGATSEEVVYAALAGAANIPPLIVRRGVSLLHATSHGVRSPVVAVARLQNTLDLGWAAYCSTDVVAALVSPTQTSDHLRALACLARRLRRPDVVAHIRASKCRETIYLALTSDEWCVSQPTSIGPVASRRRRDI